MFVSNAFVVAALFARSAFAAAALNDPTQVIQGVSGIGSGVSKLYSIGHKLNDAVPAGSAANMPYLNTVNQAINNVGPGTVPAAGSLTGSLPVTAPATGVVGQCLYSPGAITNAASLSGLQNVANYPNLGPALLSGVPLTQCGLVPAVLDLVKHILGGSGSGAPLGGLGGLLTGGGGSGLLIGLLGSGPVQPVLLNLALILGAVPNLQHQLQPACGHC
ncbi:hypothetical protein MKEN_01321900 [Mycena kentingensis (nom. inval.)]|nr:hypothetical protein MKEN_01321900 [Mycena kentingensis (nom. inval.)]